MILLLAALLPTLASGTADADGAVKLMTPGVQYKTNEATASRSPWLDSNGAKILRQPNARYYYDVPAKAASLAAAEAFTYDAHAAVHTYAPGERAFADMLAFLRGLPNVDAPALANIGVVDDGSEETGELMNLLCRRNLMYRIVPAPDRHLDLNITVGQGDFPKTTDANMLAHKVRSELGDDKRILRLYGSDVVVARITGDGARARVQLLNYASRPVVGLRVRILGQYSSGKAAGFEKPNLQLQDYSAAGGATEFTVPEMSTYLVVDLRK